MTNDQSFSTFVPFVLIKGVPQQSDDGHVAASSVHPESIFSPKGEMLEKEKERQREREREREQKWQRKKNMDVEKRVP